MRSTLSSSPRNPGKIATASSAQSPHGTEREDCMHMSMHTNHQILTPIAKSRPSRLPESCRRHREPMKGRGRTRITEGHSKVRIKPSPLEGMSAPPRLCQVISLARFRNIYVTLKSFWAQWFNRIQCFRKGLSSQTEGQVLSPP